ncbi:cell division protein SepF, partial [Burkholderia contaminans]|nr:cell division protein SepF [Burkholderia contaminans]
MSLKDRFDRFIDYFTEDEDSSLPYEKRDEPVFTSVNSSQEPALPMNQPSQSAGTKKNNITRLPARQQELANHSQRATDKVIIDVRYPRKYEDATEIVDLLAGNESILIDLQYMTEVQARRCLD